MVFNNTIIQYGWKNATGAAWQVVTLPLAYKDTNYVVVATCANNNYALWVQTITTTTFKQYQNIIYTWITIGY